MLYLLVIPQDRVNNNRNFQFKASLPHILIVVISLVAWGKGTADLLNHTINLGGYILNICWSTYNTIGAIICIYVAYQKPIHRSVERVEMQEEVRITLNSHTEIFEAKMLDISEKGIGIHIYSDKVLEQGQEVSINLNNHLVSAKVVRIKGDKVGLNFIGLNPQDKKIIAKIYMDNIKEFFQIDKTITNKEIDNEIEII